MKDVTLENLIEIAERMSQEMQEFCDDAIESGSALPGTEDLLSEWDEAYRIYNAPRQSSHSTIEAAMIKSDVVYLTVIGS